MTVTVLAVFAAFTWLKVNQKEITTQTIKTKFNGVLMSLKLMKQYKDDESSAKDEKDDSSTSDSDEESATEELGAKSKGKSRDPEGSLPLPKQKESGIVTEKAQMRKQFP